VGDAPRDQSQKWSEHQGSEKGREGAHGSKKKEKKELGQEKAFGSEKSKRYRKGGGKVRWGEIKRM